MKTCAIDGCDRLRSRFATDDLELALATAGRRPLPPAAGINPSSRPAASHDGPTNTNTSEG